MIYQLKTFIGVHFYLKKTELISNVGDSENMNHTYAVLAEVIKIWYNCCKLFIEEFIFL